MAIYIFALCFLNPDVYILENECYLDLYIVHCIYIFKRMNTKKLLFLNVCIYPGLRYDTLNFALQLRLYFLSRLFLHNWCVLNSNLWIKLYIWCPSPLNKQNKKWPPKPHLPYILRDFWFLHYFELITSYLMFSDQNDLYLTFKFKMVTANRQIKVFFMHVNYNPIKNICLMEI